MDPYVAAFEGLLDTHRKIREALEAAIAAPTDLARMRGAGNFLLAHHTIESEALFPVLRREGRLRSADVAFLDPLDRAHHELHGLCTRMLDAGPGSAGSLARATLELLIDHVAEEEAGLAPDRLRLLITPAGFEEVQRTGTALLERLRATARDLPGQSFRK
jgi:SpoVK/Ycf46/Vps4 family AAA+-type ATPase